MSDDWYVPQTRSEWAKHKRELAQAELRGYYKGREDEKRNRK